MWSSKSCFSTALIFCTSLQPAIVTGADTDPTGPDSLKDVHPYFTKISELESCDQVITVGSTPYGLILQCDADGYPKPNITWTKYGQPINDDRVTFSEWSIRFDTFKDINTGSYECKVCNRLGCINYQYFVTDFGIRSKSALLGSEYNLVCKDGNKTSSALYTPGNCFASVSDVNISMGQGRQILKTNLSFPIYFGKVSYSDAGLYLCHSYKSYLVELNVVSNWKESLSHATDRLVLKESGDSVTLSCSWRNSMVRWTKNGEPMDHTGSKLEFEYLNQDDGGLYRCEICSYANCKEYHFILAINTVFKEYSMRNISIDFVGQVQLICETVFSDYNVEYSVEYFKYRILDEHNPMIPADAEKLVLHGVVNFARVDPNDWYTCVVQSTYGVFYRSAYVHDRDQKLPVFKHFWNTKAFIQSEESKSVYMDCNVHPLLLSSTFPRTWTKDDSPLVENSDILELKNVTRNDTGVYSCEVCNDYGCAKIAFWVLIGWSPNNWEQNITVNVNDQTNLVCIDKYYPFIRKIEWRKIIGDNQIPILGPLHYMKRSITLNFQKVQSTNAGIYECLIYLHTDENNNKYSKKFYLEVLDNSTTSQNISINDQSMLVMILFACLLIVTVTLCTIFVQQKRTRSANWIKKIVISKPDSTDSGLEMTETIQMPIVQIEQYRSKAIRRAKPGMDYEFPIDPEWEFPRDSLILGCNLGEGAFGKVVRAEAFGLNDDASTSTTVAVKMLKDGFEDADVKDLVCEMEIMKMIGKHPNIINLLGCCCTNGPLYAIVEYAPHGSLKSFLQEHHPEETGEGSARVRETSSLSQQQLITFALQIATGMAYLASRKCVHRDLAARNILVSEGYVMKISDFGLARDVLDYEYYRKVTPGMLPVRWMAPESLEHHFYTFKSDVWSFGVLAWEILTLGDYPYADWEGFLDQLKRGRRMEQPALCSDELYQLLISCWQFRAEKRPSFEEIAQNLEAMLNVANNSLYPEHEIEISSFELPQMLPISIC